MLTYGAGMLIGNYVLGWWGDSIALDGSTSEGWLSGAQSFWVMPGILALGVAALFFLTFWDKEADDNLEKESDLSPVVE